MQRVFLVGCPRSGTTIIQALLGSHSHIETFPETKIFQYTLWKDFRPQLPQRLHQFFYHELFRPELMQDYKQNQSIMFTLGWFLGILDSLAIEKNKSIWIEKTPEHIFFIPEIEIINPNAKFIHVTRNGLDTIASLWEATRNSENNLWGKDWSLDDCIQRWKNSLEITKKYRTQKQHLIVKYEDLLIDKTNFLVKCCEFLAISYEEDMLTNYKTQALRLGMGLPWHEGIAREIEPPPIPKYKQVFSQSEIDYILKKLQSVDFKNIPQG